MIPNARKMGGPGVRHFRIMRVFERFRLKSLCGLRRQVATSVMSLVVEPGTGHPFRYLSPAILSPAILSPAIEQRLVRFFRN